MPGIRRYETDILVIGCGAAGMACASAAASAGASVIVADDRETPGGVLPQCAHKGFGLGRYGKEMTGPEYGEEEFSRFLESGAIYMPECRVLSICALEDSESMPCNTSENADVTMKDKHVNGGIALLSQPGGMCEISFRECVPATGCLERSIWSLGLSGTRPLGVYTAGEAQEMIELGGYDVGDNIFILGSGDIGQIMARRFRQLGKTVIAMAEISDHLGGLKRNQEECIEAYNIPVMLKTTVTEIHGYPRITGVTVHHFDTNTDEFIECETLVSALGLVPDRSLANDLKTTDANGKASYPEWLHFCGNADFVHEIADSASSQGEKLGLTLAHKLHQ
ncbi:MAG: NAD(P)/FAD-dependent oxidoreductase [Mogibacterium sp.]|nr:NAD(P)/FAD-dependent oxidoreductase [Mogibacterium sp.]